MFLQRLCSSAIKVVNLNISRSIGASFLRTAHTNVQKSKSIDEEDDLDQPIQYSTSPAAQWKASDYGKNDAPWIQEPIIIMSTISFMLYFFVFREENDIDDIIYKPLNETLPAISRVMPGYDSTPPEYVRHWDEINETKSVNNVQLSDLTKLKGSRA